MTLLLEHQKVGLFSLKAIYSAYSLFCFTNHSAWTLLEIISKTKEQFHCQGIQYFCLQYSVPIILDHFYLQNLRRTQNCQIWFLRLIAQTDIYTEPQKFHLGSVFEKTQSALYHRKNT